MREKQRQKCLQERTWASPDRIMPKCCLYKFVVQRIKHANKLAGISKIQMKGIK